MTNSVLETYGACKWRLERERVGLGRTRNHYCTISSFGGPGSKRRLEWRVYRVSSKQWAIGVGIVGERGLHTVIQYDETLVAGKLKICRMLVELGHEI